MCINSFICIKFHELFTYSLSISCSQSYEWIFPSDCDFDCSECCKKNAANAASLEIRLPLSLLYSQGSAFSYWAVGTYKGHLICWSVTSYSDYFRLSQCCGSGFAGSVINYPPGSGFVIRSYGSGYLFYIKDQGNFRQKVQYFKIFNDLPTIWHFS